MRLLSGGAEMAAHDFTPVDLDTVPCDDGMCAWNKRLYCAQTNSCCATFFTWVKYGRVPFQARLPRRDLQQCLEDETNAGTAMREALKEIAWHYERTKIKVDAA